MAWALGWMALRVKGEVMKGRVWRVWLISVLIIGWTRSPAWAERLPSGLAALTLEQLMDIEITSVSKKEEPLRSAPAAVYVITGEEIRRSGVTSIPEALRMAPGLQVAQFNANKWAVSARGFNGLFANKLLVLIDGRSVYTPLFAGVFWDVQDTLLEDIDRIEVIRGPGGTLWGANAVNGVISIITKQAGATQGGYIEGGGGKEERGFVGLRYGGKLAEGAFYRGYVKYFSRDDFVTAADRNAADSWNTYRGGFRIDWDASARDVVTVQGDIYRGNFDQTLTIAQISPPFTRTFGSGDDFAGGNILTRWRRRLTDGSEIALQFYYDRTHRDEALFREDRDTVDLDFQHRLGLGAAHDIVWGFDARVTIDAIDNSSTVVFTPRRRTDHLVSGFIQDQITLIKDRLYLTIGSKFEHNSFSGFEAQPSVRLLYSPHNRHTLWAAVSRAVRTPARSERDVRFSAVAFPGPGGLPTLVQSVGNSNFTSEELVAHEIGYRVQPTDWLAVDVAGFYNIYDNLLTNEPGTPFLETSPASSHIVAPVPFGNKESARIYGVEVATTWRPVSFWNLHLNYSYLKIEERPDPTSAEPADEERRSPRHSIQALSRLDLPWNLECDTAVYFVDRLPSFNISSYVRLDLRLGWRPTKRLDVSVVGQNLLDDRHPEFAKKSDPFKPSEVQRSVFVRATWRF